METRRNKSKYNFGALKVGDEIQVDPFDLHSMQVSLKSFNARHGRDIGLDPTGDTDVEGKIVLKVIKA